MPPRTMISARMVCLSGQTVIVACVVCFMSGRAAIVACRGKGMDPTDKMEIRPRSRPGQTGLARRCELASIGVMCGQTNFIEYIQEVMAHVQVPQDGMDGNDGSDMDWWNGDDQASLRIRVVTVAMYGQKT